MAAHLADLSGACLKALAEPKPEVLSDGVNAKSMRVENSHLMRFIEMYLAGIDPDTGDIIAECYGTYANPDIPADKDFAPQAQVETIDMEQVKKEYGVLGVSMNGPKLSATLLVRSRSRESAEFWRYGSSVDSPAEPWQEAQRQQSDSLQVVHHCTKERSKLEQRHHGHGH